MYKRIIIKVGTKILSTENGQLDIVVLKHLVSQLVFLKNRNIQIILVTSGAVGAGRSLIKSKGGGPTEKQVLAAVGQVKLMSIYSDLFAKHHQLCAQVLATKEDFRDKVHYLNMRTCFESLLGSDVIPIVNENDVVATTELLFTDNDELAGLVAAQLNADAVIILTSVEGLLGENSKVVPEIDFKNVGVYQKYILPEKTTFGRGGMLTKFNVAKKLASQGIVVHLANGKKSNILTDIVEGKRVGTKFLPHGKTSAIKRRLAHSEGLTKGTVRINQCAEDLLLSKIKVMSLLPIGVIGIKGDFNKGDIVEITGEKGQKIGFGLAEYNGQRARELMGVKKARPIIHYKHMFIG